MARMNWCDKNHRNYPETVLIFSNRPLHDLHECEIKAKALSPPYKRTYLIQNYFEPTIFWFVNISSRFFAFVDLVSFVHFCPIISSTIKDRW